MFLFLTVLQAIVGLILVALILMQKSEGGGLGVGGSPAGIMSARGAADFLTRATMIFAGLFVALAIALAAFAVGASNGQKVDTSLKREAPVAPAPAPDPLAGQANPAPAAPAPVKP